MKNGFSQLMISAFSDFKRNKVRTLLTSLGIMIGVLSVVMLIALGLGLKNYISDQFEDLGANLILVLPGSGFGGESGAVGGSGLVGGTEFDERDVANLRKIPEVELVVPLFFKGTLAETDDNETFIYAEGINPEGFALLNTEPVVGELWGESELSRRAKVAVLGYNAASELFGDPESGLGKKIRFENQRFKIVAIAKKKGDQEADNSAYIPYTTTFGSMNPDKTFWALNVGVPNDDDVEDAAKEIEDLLLERYDDDDFAVMEQSEILSTVNQIFGIINLVLIAIGSISLVVGGIGIMNIMYATVTERTKEVGIRRAIGATKKDIMLQFLTESVTLSVFGGVLGLLIATLIVLIVRIWFPVALNLIAILVAIGVSSAIGVFFGVFPARRAANLPPISAIRYE